MEASWAGFLEDKASWEEERERESGLTLVGITARGCVRECVRVRVCECVCSIQAMPLSVCACTCSVLISIYIDDPLCMRNRHLTSSNTRKITLSHSLCKFNTEHRINISIHKHMSYIASYYRREHLKIYKNKTHERGREQLWTYVHIFTCVRTH